MGTTELIGIGFGPKTHYSKHVLSVQRRVRFGFPYNVLHQVSFLKLPQSIQYPPGMEPKRLQCVVGFCWNYAEKGSVVCRNHYSRGGRVNARF